MSGAGSIRPGTLLFKVKAFSLTDIDTSTTAELILRVEYERFSTVEKGES